MVGFPYYFHVNAGHPVLQHPLYLKYNVLTVDQIAFTGDGWKDVINEVSQIMLTNDNMAILWYMRNLLEIKQLLGF